jgi:hypothetical protein
MFKTFRGRGDDECPNRHSGSPAIEISIICPSTGFGIQLWNSDSETDLNTKVVVNVPGFN